MLYLASQFVWFLVAAFCLGLVMGWLSHEGRDRQLWHPRLGLLAGVVALAAALTWSHTVNGVGALWVESALLFVVAYVAGCLLGTMLASARRAEPVVAAATVAPATATRPVSNAPASPEPPAPVAAVEAAPPKVEGEDQIPGQRPKGLVAARNQAPDDLKIIKGIGPQNEERLHALGIWHFEQIANWTPENVEWVGSYLAFPGRIERENWIEQARELAANPAPAKP